MGGRDDSKASRILAAAARVFAQRGYHAARVAEIARVAEVAHGTVYLYFRNKEELLVSLFRERLGALVETARTQLARIQDPAERLRALIQGHLQCLAQDRDFAVVTQVELRQARRELSGQIQEILHQYLALIEEIVRDGQARGVFTAQVDARQIRNVIFGAVDQTVTAWVMTGFRFDLAAQAEPTWRLLAGGLLERRAGPPPATAAAPAEPGSDGAASPAVRTPAGGGIAP